MAIEQHKLSNSEFIDVLVALRMAAGEYDRMAENAAQRGDNEATMRNRLDAERYRTVYGKLSDSDSISYTRQV